MCKGIKIEARSIRKGVWFILDTDHKTQSGAYQEKSLNSKRITKNREFKGGGGYKTHENEGRERETKLRILRLIESYIETLEYLERLYKNKN
jgi:hypothetical protein